MTNDKIRVLVIDDAVVIRMQLRILLGSEPGLEVVGTAKNGHIALEIIAAEKPDVVLLDVEMPVMGGVATLEQIRIRFPDVSVIMFSSATDSGAAATHQALALGAVDFVSKPSTLEGDAEARVREELIHAIKSTRAIHRETHPSVESAPSLVTGRRLTSPAAPIRLVAIGSSTGGPNALAELVPHFEADFPVPIIIVQHMPPVFTGHLAKRLSELSGVQFAEGEDGAVLEAGSGWVAPGGKHMVLSRGATLLPQLATNMDEKENSCRPAVDPMLRSAAKEFGHGLLTIILTGMGSDGMLGCQEVKRLGGRVIAQDEESSVVWGMPGYVARDGTADAVLPLKEIGSTVNRWVRSSRCGQGSSPAGRT